MLEGDKVLRPSVVPAAGVSMLAGGGQRKEQRAVPNATERCCGGIRPLESARHLAYLRPERRSGGQIRLEALTLRLRQTTLAGVQGPSVRFFRVGDAKISN